MADWPIIFRTSSDIEARVVTGLLEANGITVIRSSRGAAQGVFPFSSEGLSAFRIAVPPDQAQDALRLIESHRSETTAGVVVPLRREFEPLEGRLGYRFADRGLLEHALTHKSRAHEDASGGVLDNESLEFLGDAVVGLVVADLLFRECPDFTEGQKSKAKAALVSTGALAALAERIGLGEHMLLGRGEEKTGGRRKQALLADVCEALLAAIYLDGGLEEVRRIVLREMADEIAAVRSPDFLRDFKSALQEQLQSADRPLPRYLLERTAGPDHDKVFHVQVIVGDEVLAEGTGRTKKEAEQQGARRALDRLAGTAGGRPDSTRS